MILGMDLSIRGSALVCIPEDWFPGDWGRLEIYRRIRPDIHAPIDDRIEYVVDQILELTIMADTPPSCAFVEAHVFVGFQQGALPRVELVGAVKYALKKNFAVKTTPVIASQARKLLFGKLPQMKRPQIKAFVVEQLRKMGAPFSENDDLCDAFVVANYGLSELGLLCLVQE
jgi:hypothetical protein